MKRRLRIVGLLLAGLGAICPAAGRAEGRHLAVIVDTSGSMSSNDRPRYTMQLSKILSDLLDEDDELTIVRMLDNASCSAGVSSALALRLDPKNRDAFKAALDAHTQTNTGTYYAAAIRTAVDVLTFDESKKRMLLMLADSGGLGSCSAELTRVLQTLRDSGATVAAINIGLTAGAFDNNPAINFTTAARNSQELVEAVGLVYQRFLGAKRVQTGEVGGAVEVEVPPYVREAFLVVAADGPMLALEQELGNPKADGADLNFRGGGESLGRDNRRRTYRIARLLRPQAGRWSFKALGLADRAGWMLLFDSAVAVRMISPPTVAQGVATPLEFEVIDEITGRRITDFTAIPDLDLTFDVGGQKVELRDDGSGGDRQAGDGILTGEVTFDSPGREKIPVRLESDLLDRTFTIETEVVEASWVTDVKTPPRAEVSTPVDLRVELRPLGDPSRLTPPEKIEVLTGGPVVELNDAGRDGDEAAGDGVFSGTWTPEAMGTIHLDYVPQGGTGAMRTTVPLEVIGSLRFGPVRPVDLGKGGRTSELTGQLDLSSATVRGTYEVTVTSDFEVARTVLEVDRGHGWESLDEEGVALRMAENGALSWPLRLRIGTCPGSHSSGESFAIRVAGRDAEDRTIETVVPLAVEVVPDPWLVCWWPVIASILGLALAGFVIYGYWSPSRFSPRLGVVLSPEENLEEEGFFHPIRAQRGSGAGFFRDARIFLTSDFRLSSRSAGALARLRARGKQVKIEPLDGASLWRQTADGDWERLPQAESTARFGTTYKNDLGSLFFAVRNG